MEATLAAQQLKDEQQIRLNEVAAMQSLKA
eukprot:SAG22_NODE_1823_length_3509_cov_57.994721_3_plen_30_part_00